MKWPMKCLIGVAVLIGGLSTASAQTYWVQPYWSQPYGSYDPYGLKARGYYGTPYGSGPQYGSGGGDQYGYGPGYSYARQAPNGYWLPY
jgi:hypothetical protein